MHGDMAHMASGNHIEHMAAVGLVDPAEATHVAVSNGNWFDPGTGANQNTLEIFAQKTQIISKNFLN